MREGHGSPYIRIGARGRLETNLSGEQLRTVLRLAKLELEDLREILQPHKTKVIGELLDIVSLDERKKRE